MCFQNDFQMIEKSKKFFVRNFWEKMCEEKSYTQGCWRKKGTDEGSITESLKSIWIWVSLSCKWARSTSSYSTKSIRYWRILKEENEKKIKQILQKIVLHIDLISAWIGKKYTTITDRHNKKKNKLTWSTEYFLELLMFVNIFISGMNNFKKNQVSNIFLLVEHFLSLLLWRFSLTKNTELNQFQSAF